jgi:type I restriction enzyme S subunit
MSDRTVRFSELAAEGLIEVGAGRPRSVLEEYPSMPILRVADVLDGRIESPFQEHVPYSLREIMGSKISRPGDVVLTAKGTVGRVALMPPGGTYFAYSPQLCYFRPVASGPLRSRFLYYWFKSSQFWDQANAVKGQTDMADYLSLLDIQALEIGIPSLDRQDGIVDILGSLDDKIAVNDAIGARADALLAAHFSAGSLSVEREVKLGDIIDLKYGKALKEENRSPGRIPVFGGNGISGSHSFPLADGPGIVVGRKGANAGSVSWSQTAFWAIDTSFYVKPIGHEFPLEFLFFLIGAAGLRNLVGDSAIPGLNREIALSCSVGIPGKAVIRRFGDTAKPLMALKAQIAEESRSLAELRVALLPKLMSGEIRVRNAEKVVEDVTLWRGCRSRVGKTSSWRSWRSLPGSLVTGSRSHPRWSGSRGVS